MSSRFMTAEWRKLILVNYEINPDKLIPFLPYKTELDSWNGKHLVSLVGFRFINTKLKGIALPFHRNFEEINLRFYVRFKEGNIWKRGVTFIKEIVPKPALTFVANIIYNEKYVTFPTRHRWGQENGSLNVSYEWRHNGSWDTLEVNAASTPLGIPQGSEEEFITEHYWGYTKVNEQRSSEYQVEHPRWQTYAVKDHKISVRFGELYGAAFEKLKTAQPHSVMLAEGSAIVVHSASKIDGQY